MNAYLLFKFKSRQKLNDKRERQCPPPLNVALIMDIISRTLSMYRVQRGKVIALSV